MCVYPEHTTPNPNGVKGGTKRDRHKTKKNKNKKERGNDRDRMKDR